MKKRFKQNLNKGFSSIVAILIVGFLVILSSGILSIILQESRNTRIVSDTISTYAGAEGSLEYALLKIKNHKEGFQDNIVYDGDYDSKLLLNDFNNFKFAKDQIIEYEINNYSKDYSGAIEPGAFEIIPLFFDKGFFIQTNAKNPNKETSDMSKTNSFKVENLSGDLVWNIIGNNSDGATFGIVGTGGVSQNFGTGYSDITKTIGAMKNSSPDTNISITDAQKIDFDTGIDIGSFLNSYENNYLIMYNSSSNSISYHIISNEGFSLPKTQIIASSSIGNFKQNIEFTENKSKLFDALKYSLFND